MTTTLPEALEALAPGHLKRFHPMDLQSGVDDLLGGPDALLGGSGATFSKAGATVDGKGYLEFPDHPDWSVATTGAITIAFRLAILDWTGGSPTQGYVHLAGKGDPDDHEYTFRHYSSAKPYVGEAATRQGRLSVYEFNPTGGLGAGSYWEDPTLPTRERLVVAVLDKVHTTLYVDANKPDQDALADYKVVPQDKRAPFRFGTRDMVTGFLKGRGADLALFNVGLTASQVATLRTAYASLPRYAETSPPPVVTPPTPTGPNVDAALAAISQAQTALLVAERALTGK